MAEILNIQHSGPASHQHAAVSQAVNDALNRLDPDVSRIIGKPVIGPLTTPAGTLGTLATLRHGAWEFRQTPTGAWVALTGATTLKAETLETVAIGVVELWRRNAIAANGYRNPMAD